MKVDVLSKAISSRLRRHAANDLANIALRRGEGPSYDTVLKLAADRLGVAIPDDEPGLAEHVIAMEHTRSTWHLLPDRERTERWQEARGDLPAPAQGDQALEKLKAKHTRGFSYHVMQLINEPSVPLPGCMFLAWLARPRFDIVLPAILEVGRLRQAVRHRVTIGVVGSPSSGKDAAIATLFGIQTGNVSPVAGSTKEVEIARLPGPTYRAVGPGMGDIIKDVHDEARAILDHIDVYLYVINAQGGVQAREKRDYVELLRTGRPVLAVINKIDTIREPDRERYLEDARAKLRAQPEDFLAAAFDPLPQLSESPLNIPLVRKWIADRLSTLGKDPTELPWLRYATKVERPPTRVQPSTEGSPT